MHRDAKMLRTLPVGVVLLVAGLLTAGLPGEADLGPARAMAQQTTLNVGDVAPPLAVSDWVKKGPVTLAEGRGKKVYLIEFWAIWCTPCIVSIPHLTELQHEYKDDLVVIGVTSMDPRNTLASVRAFVERQGAKMDFAVGFERSPETTARYLAAAGVQGIPHAFIIGRDGRIAWQGSPLEPGMDEVVKAVVAGDFDLAKSKRQQEARQHLQRFFMLTRMGDYAEGAKSLQEALKVDPGNLPALNMLHALYREQLQDPAGLRRILEQHVDQHIHEPEVMAAVADLLALSPGLQFRYPDLTARAGDAAWNEGEPPTGLCAQAYASVQYMLGNIEQAIAAQRRAVQMTEGDWHREAQDRLDYYVQCQALRTGDHPSPASQPD